MPWGDVWVLQEGAWVLDGDASGGNTYFSRKMLVVHRRLVPQARCLFPLGRGLGALWKCLVTPREEPWLLQGDACLPFG